MKRVRKIREPTLQLRWPFGYTIGLAFGFLVLFLSLVEMAVNTDFVQSVLPTPSIASGQKRLDVKLAYINDLVEKEGQVDCIFLGGSIVNAAIDPAIFNQVYKTYTGKEIICFNFGIDRLIPPAAAIMAKILTEKYKPKLLVWGLTPSAFSKRLRRKTKLLLMENSWCKYRLGDYNFEGWLADFSFACRYFLKFRIWLEQPKYFKELLQCEKNTLKYGIIKHSKKVKAFKPDPNRVSKFRIILKNFEIAKDAIDAMERIMQLHSQTEIVIVEIPFHPSLMSLYDGGADTHYRISSRLNMLAKEHEVLYIPSARQDLIPDNGWRNNNHMNIIGARVFSQWLGKQLGEAVVKGLVKIPLEKGLNN